MTTPLKEIIVKILTIINYPRDKQKFALEFEQMNYAEAVTNIIEQLPMEQQQQVRNSTNLQKTLKQTISEEAFRSELEKVSYNSLPDFLQAFWETITPEQQTAIGALIKTA